MKENLWNIILYLLIFILQVFIANYIDIGAYVYICLIPLVLFGIPMNINNNVTMIAAFVIGLLLDLFSSGVMGLNAASATMLAALRAPIYNLTVNKDRRYSVNVPSIRSIGLNNYLVYTSLGTLIYLTTYTLLDCASFRPLPFIILRIAVSLIINEVLIAIISNSIIDRE